MDPRERVAKMKRKGKGANNDTIRYEWHRSRGRELTPSILALLPFSFAPKMAALSLDDAQVVEQTSEAKKPEKKKPKSKEPKAKKAKVEKGKKVKDPNMPKRPPTAFFVFFSKAVAFGVGSS
ncbi:High mobility group B protein 7 [Spatholobus suberectus]|nr:High mobility group B protein 7 [Spatholobus suberectus]